MVELAHTKETFKMNALKAQNKKRKKTMNYSYIIQGFLIGFSVATSIGISGVLCLQNIMTGRVRIALASVFAAACADVTCASVVVFGLSALQFFLMKYHTVFSIVTGVFLCLLGLYRIFNVTALHQSHKESQSAWHAFFAVFFLGVVDPVSVMDFAALSLGLTFDFALFAHAAQFLMGLFWGSLFWWSSLFLILLYFRRSISDQVFARMQQLVGGGLIGLGVYLLLGSHFKV